VVFPFRWGDEVDSGAAAGVGVSGGVFEGAEREVGLEGGQVGAVDVEGGHFGAAGWRLEAGPVGAGFPDVVCAVCGFLAQDVGQRGVADDVVAGAGAAGVQEGHGVRDGAALEFGGRRFHVAAVCGEGFVHGAWDEFVDAAPAVGCVAWGGCLPLSGGGAVGAGAGPWGAAAGGGGAAGAQSAGSRCCG
jgi:hypothetical protein